MRKFVIMLSLKVPPHPKFVATLPCEMSGVLKGIIENKMTSVSTHFKKLTTGNNVFIVSVIVWGNCHILQFLHQMFNVSSLLLDGTLKPATPRTNGAINGVTGLSASSSGNANIMNIWCKSLIFRPAALWWWAQKIIIIIIMCVCTRVCSWFVCGTAAIHQRSPLSLWHLDRSQLPL